MVNGIQQENHSILTHKRLSQLMMAPPAARTQSRAVVTVRTLQRSRLKGRRVYKKTAKTTKKKRRKKKTKKKKKTKRRRRRS